MQTCSPLWPQRFSVGVSLFLVLVLLFTACDTTNQMASPQKPTLTSRLDAFFTSEVNQKMFSGSVLITRGSQVLLRKGYSMADWAHGVHNTQTTKFQIASLTKAFTAIAILILQERGKLHVHDRICKYVSACPQVWQPITIHQLLTHTSGMARDLSYSDEITTMGLPSSPERNLITLKKKGLDFPPGTQYSYSNLGYILLGYLIEKVSGEPFALFLQQNIFAPLQMMNTGIDENDPPHVSNLATGYTGWQSRLGIADALDLSIYFAAGGLYSTVDDLYRWDQALYTQKLVSQKSLDAMFTPYVSMCSGEPCPTPFSEEGYGYGWIIVKESPSHRRVIGHTGGLNGFWAFLGRYPDDKVSIILLSNLGTVDTALIIPHLESIVFAKSQVGMMKLKSESVVRSLISDIPSSFSASP